MRLKTLSKSKRLCLGALLACVTVLCVAQTSPTPDFAPPTVHMVDVVGVAMNSGRPNFTISPVKIGPAADPFSFFQTFSGGMNYSVAGYFGLVGYRRVESVYSQGDRTVSVMGSGDQLKDTGDGHHFVSRNGDGGTLSISPTFVYQYIDRTGTIFDFTNGQDPAGCGDVNPTTPNCAVLAKVTYPTGVSVTIGPFVSVPGDSTHFIQKITRSDGYQFVIDWTRSQIHYLPVPRLDSYYMNKVTAYNMAVDYCDPAATACTFSKTWPTASAVRSTPAPVNPGDTLTFTLTDSAGSVSRYTEQYFLGVIPVPYNDAIYQLLTRMKPASSPTADVFTYTYANQGFCYTYTDVNGTSTDCTRYQRDLLIQSVTAPQGQWTYTYTHDGAGAPPQSMVDGLYTTTVKRPDYFTESGQFNASTGYISWIKGTPGSIYYNTDYINASNLIQNSTDAEGRTYSYHYDGRGNLQEKDQGTGPKWRAVYPPTCPSVITCNKPTQLIDPNGNTTDYTYDPVHGGVLSETKPAVDVNGTPVRPQTRFGYVQRTPWLKNASGGYSSAAPVWKLANESICRSVAGGSHRGLHGCWRRSRHRL